MKIEIGESLLLSWLKHIKDCQLVQLNWKSSTKWEFKHRQPIDQIMINSAELFSRKYNYDIYKGNKSIDQLIGQAEIDVMGISYDGKQNQIYAIDVAFHEAGLNYGSKSETVARVIKKMLRAAMCIYGYFGINTGTIIFASPKISPSVYLDLMRCLDDIGFILNESGMNYDVRIIGNVDFAEKILEPVLNTLDEVADTSELFMRSLQMYNLFASKRQKQTVIQRGSVTEEVTHDLEMIEPEGLEGLKEMKIGVIVRTILRRIIESGKVPEDEIERMQSKEYSKETFHIQYPLLLKAILTQDKSPARYYTTPIKVYGEVYFLCSEWYEIPTNNDRPYLMKWLDLHK